MKFENIKKWIGKHKILSVLILAVVAFIIYKLGFGGTPEATTEYQIGLAEKGSVISYVSGIGQVSASNRLDLTSEVSGTITYVPVKLGNPVKKGTVLASMDSGDAKRAVQNSEISLENAKIAYEKAQKNLSDQSDTSSISDVNKAYDDGYTAVSSAMIDIPDIIEDLNDIYYDPTHSVYFNDQEIRTYAGDDAVSYKYESGRQFDQIKKDFDLLFKSYRSINKADKVALSNLIEDVYELMKDTQKSLTGTYNTIDYIKNRLPSDRIPAAIATDKSTISAAINRTNTHVTNLSDAITDIDDAQDNSTEATLDLKTAELNVSTAEDNLNNAREDLANHVITAPFDGVIGKVDVEVGDKVSSNSAIATLITDEKIAEITLNEVDVSKVSVGQKATLTFDAVDDLTITGTVTEVDLLGEVNQGVVNYTVQIAFDVNDERVKSGMSLNASIIGETKQNVVRVPNSAIKSQGETNFVERLEADGTITRVPVEVGLSNDEYTEVISGLTESEAFISRTITASNNAPAQAPSLFGGGGGGTRSFQAR